MEELVNYGVDIYIEDVCRWILLYCVFKCGYVDMVKYFINCGCDLFINIFIVKLKLVLFWVVKRNYVDVLKELIVNKVDVNFFDENGELFLYFVFKCGYFEVVCIFF